MSQKTIVVFGATGHQGGAVLRALQQKGGWQVRALSRNPASESAQALKAQGVEVVKGDMDDDASLTKAFQGAYGVFSVQGTDQGIETEIRRGIAVADAARKTGIEHFVYSSVGGADRHSGVPHFESKWRIEEHIRKISLPATVVRPVFFMDNFRKPVMRTLVLALVRRNVPPQKPLQMIASDDIGKWVAMAFANPEDFIGKSEEIAGDELTYTQIVRTFRHNRWFAGLPFPLPDIILKRLPYDVRKMFEWFGSCGYKSDLATLRTRHPDFLTFENWLKNKI